MKIVWLEVIASLSSLDRAVNWRKLSRAGRGMKCGRRNGLLLVRERARWGARLEVLEKWLETSRAGVGDYR